MRIFYIITRGDVIGGANVHLLDLASGMKELGHQVKVAAGGEGAFSNKVKNAGIDYISLKFMRRDIDFFNDIKSLWELGKIIKKNRPDVVHVHSSKAGILGRLVCKVLNVPVIFTVHGWAFTEGVAHKKRILYIFVEKFMSFFSGHIITVSDYDRELALKNKVVSSSTMITIHNGVKDRSSSKNYSNNKRRLIMVARFDYPKDQEFLLRSLALLKDDDWSLEFVGDGPLLDSAKQVAENLGLSDCVTFSGTCDDVPERLAAADIFLLISNWEALPLSVIEAMASSLPVIASNVGGIKELVEDQNSGLLVAKGDHTATAMAIRQLLHSPELREKMGKAGRKRYENGFTYQVMLQKTCALYSRVISRVSA